MSPEDEKYYENYLSMFLQPGWQQFVNETEDLLDSHSIDDIKTEKELYLLQGQRKTLLSIVNFEVGIKNAFDLDSEND